jgi:hypothetical protein
VHGMCFTAVTLVIRLADWWRWNVAARVTSEVSQ